MIFKKLLQNPFQQGVFQLCAIKIKKVMTVITSLLQLLRISFFFGATGVGTGMATGRLGYSWGNNPNGYPPDVRGIYTRYSMANLWLCTDICRTSTRFSAELHFGFGDSPMQTALGPKFKLNLTFYLQTQLSRKLFIRPFKLSVLFCNFTN